MTKASSGLTIAIIGAGIGGLAAAAALLRTGHNVHVFEQARAFARVGAGIQQGPNSVKVLRAFGLEPRLRQLAFQPGSSLNRQSDTGDITWERQLGQHVEDRYGAPYFYMHRGDLHAALASIVAPERVTHGMRLSRFDAKGEGVTLHFENGEQATADLVVGADGVHSIVRAQLFGAEQARFTGRVAYRTTFPASLLDEPLLDGSAKWWGPDRHIVLYYVNPRKDEVYFVTSTPEPEFEIESWSEIGNLDTLRAAYADFHPRVRAVLDVCPAVHKWALVEREPMPQWSGDRVTLLGDACHPMTPYMAQGAATSIEDAAVLSRALSGVGTASGAGTTDINHALAVYENSRKSRTARIQQISRLNDMAKIRAETDAVYSYDAWTAPLAEG
jgi:6-hydroxynicotinate 3-monooxygenase